MAESITRESYAITGLPGATLSGRIVGVVSGSAPTSGNFLAGDFVIDQAGSSWVCISGGNPGSWTKTGTVFSGGTVNTLTISGLTPGGVVFTGSSGNLVDTGSTPGGATGSAGALLMSYGAIQNGGPEWVNYNIHQTVQAVATTSITGTYTVSGNSTNDYPLLVDTWVPSYSVTTSGILNVDGYNVQAGDRILLAGQGNAAQNGVYVCTAQGSSPSTSPIFCRDNDVDTVSKLVSSIIQISQGNTYGGTSWQCALSPSGILGTTAVPFYQIISSNTQKNGTFATFDQTLMNIMGAW